jgi:hypothetical protein
MTSSRDRISTHAHSSTHSSIYTHKRGVIGHPCGARGGWPLLNIYIYLNLHPNPYIHPHMRLVDLDLKSPRDVTQAGRGGVDLYLTSIYS